MAAFTSCSFFCLLFFCIAFFRASAFASEAPLSQPHLSHQADPGSPSNGYSMDSRIIISTLGILFFIAFTIVVLHIYAKWCWWRRAHAHQRMVAQLEGLTSPSPAPHASAKPSALDKEIVKALPTFAYKPQVFRRTNDSLEAAAEGKAAECAVCLAEFRQGEACKVLPKCGHFFHTRCIDLWFLSNSTCPLCRATPGILAVDEEAARPPVGEAFDEECQELQRALWCKYNTATDEEKPAQNLHIRLNSGISSQGRKWKRSFSEKFCGSVNREAAPLSNDAQIPTRPPLIWGRSASHSTIDSLRRDAESLVESSSCACVLRAPSSHADCQNHHHEYNLPLGAPKSLVRLSSK